MKEKIYYVLVFALCIVSVAFAAIDFTTGLSQTQKLIDQTIYFFFVTDYVVRLISSEDKKIFFKDNIFDLLAIIPVSPAFRAFRILRIAKVARLSRFLKLTKLFRVGSLSGRLLVKSRQFFNTNGFKYVLILCVSLIGTASLAMMHFEKMKLADAIWWSIVTTATVGYGDLSPTTQAGRAIAIVLMLTGIGLIGSLTSTITSFFLHSGSRETDNDKVKMVRTLYDMLSNEEKAIFINDIKEDMNYEIWSKKTEHQEIRESKNNGKIKEAGKEHGKSTVWKEGDGSRE